MSAKISRTILILLCILVILPMPETRSRQAFFTIVSDFAPDAEALETDTGEQAENGDETVESDTTEQPESDGEPLEPDAEEQEESTDEPIESDTEEQEENDSETSESSSEHIEDQAAELPQVTNNELLWEQNSEPETESSGEDMDDYEGLAALYNLASNERVVKTFSELKAALSENNGVTAVHLGNDITMQGGIAISSSKSHIIIDGLDPTNPTQTEPYTLTDLDSASFIDTIYADSSAISYIHVRDLKITGKNYYGPFSVLDAAAMSGLNLIFERVDYNGPQLGHHRQGKMYVIDCTVRLHGGNGICPVQEFSEAKGLIFEGVNTIDTATTAYSVFWHPLGGSLTVADDSSVTLISPNTSTAFGLFYADGAAYGIDITVGQRSVFDATILNSVAPIVNATISSVTVREGGSFNLTTTGAANRTVLSVGGDIKIEPEAAFKINSFGGGYPALNLREGDITVGKDAVFHITSINTNSSLLNLYGRSLICNDPASTLLYNPGNRDMLATTTAGGIYIDAEQVNYWNTASESGFDNPPRYQWKKANGANFRINGTLATGANGNLSGISSNYVAGDSPGTPPAADTFNIVSARVLAFGRLELMVNTPTASSTELTGITAPYAIVRAAFYNQGIKYTTPEVTADEDGVFIIPTDLPVGQLNGITVMSCHLYLSAECAVNIGEAGGLRFTAPDELQFYTATLSPKTQIVKRLHPNWRLMVSDTAESGNWSIYVRELQPLTPADPTKPALENALVFADDTGIIRPLGTNGTMLVYRHDAAAGGEMVNIGWASERGILARIPTGAAYSNQRYTGVIEWSLIDAP